MFDSHRLWFAVLSICAVLAVPSSAAALGTGTCSSTVFYFDDGSDNDITVSVAAGHLMIHDTTGVLNQSGCTQTAPDTLDAGPVAGISSLNVDANAGGDNKVTIGSPLPFGQVVLLGGNGHDELTGNAEDDYLSGGFGNDTLDGGGGRNVADFGGAAAAVTVNLATGTATGQGMDTLTNIQDVTGSQGSDWIVGSAGGHAPHRGAGHDHPDR